MRDNPLEHAEQIAIAICGSLVAVELISRFLGARSADVAKLGTISGGLLYLVVGMIPLFLGLSGAVLAAKDPAFKAALTENERVVPLLAQHFLPNWESIVFNGAIISAILATVHSALHAPASQLSHNIVTRLMPNREPSGKLRSVRLSVMALCAVAFVLALTSDRIKDLVEIASSFGSAGVFVTACFAIFTNFGGPKSAAAAMLGGAAVWAAGRFMLDWPAPYIAGLIFSLAAYIAVALFERQPQLEQTGA